MDYNLEFDKTEVASIRAVEGEERLAGRGKKAWSFKCTKKNQDKEEAAEKEDEEAGVSRF